jgi:CRISPR/Cas system-associated endonuclease Cas3-HD
MLKRKHIVLVIVVFVAVLVTLGAAAPQKDSVTRAPDKVLLGQEHVEQLLLLMDADKNGKISKKEWMDYMSAEFDRLDKDKCSELDVKEIRSRLRVSHFANVGK